MNNRHEEELWRRMDNLYTTGTTFISWEEMRYWYESRRISKTPWRDIRIRWRKLLEQKKENYFDPSILRLSGGIVFFAAKYPEKLGALAD